MINLLVQFRLFQTGVHSLLKHEATSSIATRPLPGWDACPSQGYPQQCVAGYHFVRLGGKRDG